MERNAIILAAGKSDKFAPFTYEKPKGLFCVKGDVLIERQIEQLQEAGVMDIYVVVGYMKEKFFYLEQKYGVKLLVNNQFGKKGNLYSLYVARNYLKNTYICCADHYFPANPYLNDNPENLSYRACTYLSGKFREFAIDYSDAKVITGFNVGGRDGMAMVGHAYMNEGFSSVFRQFLENEINDFGVSDLFWEEFYAGHQRSLTFYMKEYQAGEIYEFENIDDLREFDSEFLMNVDSDIITNICNTLGCVPNDITDINAINAGLTNVSFSFQCGGEKYVYRHPGGTSGNLIDRTTELFAQEKAGKLGIDESVIKMDLSGWKISHYIHNARNCNLEESDEQLETIMDYLHRIHSVDVASEKNVKVFDNVAEANKLMEMASMIKGNLKREFAVLIEKIDILYDAVRADAKRLGYGLVLCHNDVYEPNFIYDSEGKVYLVDWEYAGMNYAANDVGSIICRYDFDDCQIERYFRAYIGHELTDDERRFYYAYIPISAYYFFCWGLYKGSIGENDGFFFLSSYRNMIRFIDVALESYGIVI